MTKQIITLKTLNLAIQDVSNELNKHGLWDSQVSSVRVVLVNIKQAYGLQHYGGSGDIHIPMVSLCRLADIFTRNFTSLRDVLRHEYAHAVAHTHRGLIRSKHFSEAFDSHHHWDFNWEYDPEIHVSKYAASAPAEDFAETFMYYLKHDGKLPSRYRTPKIEIKWNFIRNIAHLVSKGIRRWPRSRN